MGTFPVQRGRRCGGVRHTATAAGRAFGPSSLCYMTKDPLSPGFFPHRPGGYLKVPSQLFKGAQIPSSVRGDDETRRGGPRRPPPACLVLSPRNAALPTQIPTTPRPDTLKVPSQLRATQIPSSVRAPAGARNAAARYPDPHNPQTRHHKGAQPTTQLTQIPSRWTKMNENERR